MDRKLNWLRNVVADHALPIMIGGAVVIATIMTAISLNLYNSSGASKLDMSRPGYEDVRDQINGDDTPKQADFSAEGTLGEKSINQFKQLYNDLRGSLDGKSDFSSDTMSDEALGLSGASGNTNSSGN